MKFSIVTATYNSEQTVLRTLQSVESQTFCNYEHIIMDGASSDGTLKIIERYKSPKRRIFSERDKGIFDALNKGILNSSGEYIITLHADDVFSSNMTLEKINSFIDHNPSEMYLSIVNLYSKNFEKKIRVFDPKSFDPSHLAWGVMPPHCGMVIKKELFSKYGNYQNDENFPFSADFELAVRLFANHKQEFCYYGNELVKMAKGGQSTQGIKSYIIIGKEMWKSLEINGIRPNFFKLLFRFVLKFFDKFK